MTVHWTSAQEDEFRRLWNEGMGVVAMQRHFRISQATQDKIRIGLGLPTRASRFWTPELEAKAKRLYIDQGLSAEATALQIGAASRNAIIGIAHRRGWMTKGRAQPGTPSTQTRIKAPKVARTHIAPPKPGPQNKPAVVMGAYQTSTPELQAARAAEGRAANDKVAKGMGVDSPNARPWMETRKLDECNWPIGERGAIMSCCNPVKARGWCAGHLAMGVAPVQPQAMRPRAAASLARFDRVERDGPVKPYVERSIWDEGRAA